MHPETVLAQPLAFMRVLLKTDTMRGRVYQAVKRGDVLARGRARCCHVYAHRRQPPVRYERGESRCSRPPGWWRWRRPLGGIQVGSVPQDGQGNGREVPARGGEDVFIVGWLHRHQVPLFFVIGDCARDAVGVETKAVRRVWRVHVIVVRFTIIHLVSMCGMISF